MISASRAGEMARWLRPHLPFLQDQFSCHRLTTSCNSNSKGFDTLLKDKHKGSIHTHIIKNKKTGSLCLQLLTCYTKPSWVQHPPEPHVLPTPGNVFISFSSTCLMLSSEIYKLVACRWGGVEVLLFHCLTVDFLHSQNPVSSMSRLSCHHS